MSRKSTSKTSAKRHTAIPTKAASPAQATERKEETKLGTAATAVTTATAPAPAATSATSVAPVAKPECCGGSTACTPAKSALSNDHAAVAGLIASLRDADADDARNAATSLGDSKNAAAVEPLIHVLQNTDGYHHSVVRAAAATSLGKLGDARAIAALTAAVRDPIAEPSAEAIHALGELGDARAVGTLTEVVRNPTGYFLPIARRAAVQSLARIGTEHAIAELRTVADNANEDALIRQTAAESLKCKSGK